LLSNARLRPTRVVLTKSEKFPQLLLDKPLSIGYNIHMKTLQTITEITVDRKGLVRKTVGDSWSLVVGYTPHIFLKVGELYVETRQIMGAYGVSTEPFGNCRNIPANTPMQAAEKVQADYDALLANGKKLSLPIPQSYIDRWGTGME
tara:strand:+ start:429 stop:869 length:441 start_codon:yes stop_codon:yes gene_type:complete